MKQFYNKILFLVFFVQLSIAAQVFNWEWQNPLPTGADQNDAIILSSNKFMLFGNGSAVTVSADAGNTWTISYIDSLARDINAAVFTDQNTGYIVGNSGLIMKTTDGGNSWAYQTSGIEAYFMDVDFINANVGYIVGNAGNILKTTNGGETWIPSLLGSTTIYKVHYVTESLIFLGSASATTGRLLRSTNGGTTWDDISANITGLDGTVRGIHFIDSNTGWISNSTGKIYKTTDGGTTGAINYNIGSTTAAIYEVKFIDADNGYAVTTAGRVIKTTNGGTNWGLTQTSATGNLFSLGILGINSDDVTPLLAGGDFGTIVLSLDDGVTWQTISSSVTTQILYRVSFPTETTGYAVGGSITSGNSFGDVLKTTNGGETWTKLAFNPGYRIYSVFFLNENTGFIGVQGPTGVYKTTDGGANWTQLNTSTGVASNSIYDIKFYNENLGFAMYSNGEVARTTNGGVNWVPVSANWGAAAGYEIFLADSQTIYLCGGGNRISKSTNAGLSFSQLGSLGTIILYSMHFFDAAHGFIAGSGGKLYKTENGLSFTEIQLPTTATFQSIRFATDNIGWLGGTSGVLYYTLDGGNNWIPSHISIGSTQTIRDMRLAGSRLWLVGTDGLIIRGYADPVIPVELTAFTANVIGSSVFLNWSTATETNNYGFEIERQLTAGSWETIGFVSGYGTTTEPKSYSFKDDLTHNLSLTQSYRLKQIDYDGSITYSQEIEIDVKLPNVFELEQNYPNPFNPNTTIRYQIRQDGFVTLKIYDILGIEVAVLVNEETPQGIYNVQFTTNNLSSGVYFYQLKAGEFIQTKKMIYLK